MPFSEVNGSSASATVTTRAPGRVNVIGDHTDYADGLVLPVAIQLETRVTARLVPTAGLRVTSTAMDEERFLPPDRIDASGLAGWTRYIYGVYQLLLEVSAAPRGAKLRIESDVPPGAGLASSAALEVATALALCSLSGRSLPPVELALLCRRAENEFAGSPCGIMDQMVSACARAGHALLIDCRDLQMEHVPFRPRRAGLVVFDTGVRHSIAGAGYASRRCECEEALTLLRARSPRIRSLRDVTESDLAEAGALPELLRQRVRHIVRENDRVLKARTCLENGDATGMGRLMLASHESLRDDYGVSCAELDALVDVAVRLPGVYGARMTGGGFGGCVVCLVDDDRKDALRTHVAEAYDRQFGRPLRSLAVTPSGGASIL